MLELRPSCECCDKNIALDSAEGYICSFECTFCESCATNILKLICPNCGGNLVQRPQRPLYHLKRYPGSTKRVYQPAGCTQ